MIEEVGLMRNLTPIDRARFLLSLGRKEEACVAYEKAHEIDPCNIPLLLEYAKNLQTMGKTKEALKRFWKAWDIDREYVRSLVRSGDFLLRVSKAEFERALELGPNNLHMHTRLSYVRVLRAANRLDEASKHLERAMDLQSAWDEARSLAQQASTLVSENNLEEALNLFQESLQINSSDVITLTGYANALAKVDRSDEALEYFQRSLQLDPSDVITLNSYAGALVRVGKPDEALQYFQQSLRLNSSDVITLTAYANALVRVNQAEKALCYYQQALECIQQLPQHNSSHAFTFTSYANALTKVGKTEEALQHLRHSLDLDPDNANTQTRYANALARIGRTEEALDYFHRALQIDSSDVFTLIGYANALVRVGRDEESLAYFGRALTVEPDNSQTLFSIATVLQMQRQPEAALEKLHKILELNGPDRDNFIIHISMGRQYFLLGRDYKGIAHYNKALAGAYDEDAARLRIARDLMSIRPRHEYANELLRGIGETSHRYSEAQTALALNLQPSAFFQAFGGHIGGQIDSQTELYRALYHRIGNLVAILRENFYQKPGVQVGAKKYLSDLSDILRELKARRSDSALESGTHQSFHNLSYEDVVNTVSRAAHDIVDFVGNKIGALREGLWMDREEFPHGDKRIELYDALIRDVQNTLGALEELKRTNEGVRIHSETVSLRDLLMDWSEPPGARTRIEVTIGELDAKRFITLDAPRVRGFLSELVGNSLKHNSDKLKEGGLVINLTVSVMDGLPLGRDGTVISIPGVEYLVTVVKDNGKGVAKEDKELIFQPLYTTAPDDEGTGLGLFQIRRALEQMGGSIHETGGEGTRGLFRALPSPARLTIVKWRFSS